MERAGSLLDPTDRNPLGMGWRLGWETRSHRTRRRKPIRSPSTLVLVIFNSGAKSRTRSAGPSQTRKLPCVRGAVGRREASCRVGGALTSSARGAVSACRVLQRDTGPLPTSATGPQLLSWGVPASAVGPRCRAAGRGLGWCGSGSALYWWSSCSSPV